MLCTIYIDAVTLQFYEKIAEQVSLPVEYVLSDALFKLAGELALESIQKKQQNT